MSLKPLTKSQAVVLMVWTGAPLLDGPTFRKEIAKKLGREPEPMEFAMQSFIDELQELYKEDYMKIADIVEDSGLIVPGGHAVR